MFERKEKQLKLVSNWISTSPGHLKTNKGRKTEREKDYDSGDTNDDVAANRNNCD